MKHCQPHRTSRAAHQGFTLIEMLLVIAVIAIMATLGLTAYRRHAITARVDKVAIEMQHLLEAALAYNVDQHQWPTPHKESRCEASQPDESDAFVTHYLPNENAKSSLGPYFCWSSAKSLDAEKGDARLFWVALKVSNRRLMLAQRIAARLPNAVVTSDLDQAAPQSCDTTNCYVRAEVVQPAATSNRAGGRGMVVAIGDCPSPTSSTNAANSTCTRIPSSEAAKYRITFNACPTGTLPRVVAFPNFIKYPANNYPGFTVKNIDAERTNDACTLSAAAEDEKQQSCDVIVHATTCMGAGPFKCSYADISQLRRSGSVGASYVVACLPSAA
jgi:prepilin-type N-terminal cleavage/methylation domain-containing protein